MEGENILFGRINFEHLLDPGLDCDHYMIHHLWYSWKKRKFHQYKVMTEFENVRSERENPWETIIYLVRGE